MRREEEQFDLEYELRCIREEVEAARSFLHISIHYIAQHLGVWSELSEEWDLRCTREELMKEGAWDALRDSYKNPENYIDR